MELKEKLVALRKEKNLTQEQVGEKLFVSRTAVSKWESGKGFPNLDSLKGISMLFNISIDELLSTEDLLNLANKENKENQNKIVGLAFGLLDLMALSFIFFPFYANLKNGYYFSVSLFEFETRYFIKMSYYAIYLLLASLGAVEIVSSFLKNKKFFSICKIISFSIASFSILLFMTTREPYAGSLMFMLLLIKALLVYRTSKNI